MLPRANDPPRGMRYTMTLKGAARGDSGDERDAKLAGLVRLLAQELEVGRAYSTTLRAWFDRPIVLQRQVRGSTLEFTLLISFDADAGPSPAHPAFSSDPPFTFEPGDRRDPFSPK